jgi:hypothetical protein
LGGNGKRSFGAGFVLSRTGCSEHRAGRRTHLGQLLATARKDSDDAAAEEWAAQRLACSELLLTRRPEKPVSTKGRAQRGEVARELRCHAGTLEGAEEGTMEYPAPARSPFPNSVFLHTQSGRGAGLVEQRRARSARVWDAGTLGRCDSATLRRCDAVTYEGGDGWVSVLCTGLVETAA